MTVSGMSQAGRAHAGWPMRMAMGQPYLPAHPSWLHPGAWMRPGASPPKPGAWGLTTKASLPKPGAWGLTTKTWGMGPHHQSLTGAWGLTTKTWGVGPHHQNLGRGASPPKPGAWGLTTKTWDVGSCDDGDWGGVCAWGGGGAGTLTVWQVGGVRGRHAHSVTQSVKCSLLPWRCHGDAMEVLRKQRVQRLTSVTTHES